MKIEEVQHKFVWPMEQVIDGKIKFKIRPSDADNIDLGQFRAIGKTSIWVTPKIPLIIPITIGYLLSAIVGNPMTAIGG